MSKKQELGQFMTTRCAYILQGLEIPADTPIIEPFAGNGDLTAFAATHNADQIECYDIDPQHQHIVLRDTILDPPSYAGKFVLTNPPYLARNKTAAKVAFDLYGVNDLYKCFIKEICTNTPVGGIVIIPLNFWSSIRKADAELRRQFLSVFSVARINVFEERVFDDTTTTVCAFQFSAKSAAVVVDEDIPVCIYPQSKQILVQLNAGNEYTIGGEIYKLEVSGTYTITRLTAKNRDTPNKTNVVVKCIDDNSAKKIKWLVVEDADIVVDETPNQSGRTYATLVIEPPISLKQQRLLATKCNAFLETAREKYHSLFLPNYRESKDIARKRISFELAYSITAHMLDTI